MNDKIQENEVHLQFKNTYLTQKKHRNHGMNNLIRQNQIKSYSLTKEEYRLCKIFKKGIFGYLNYRYHELHSNGKILILKVVSLEF